MQSLPSRYNEGMTNDSTGHKSPLSYIIHIDMDAFYASVEMRDDPALRGKPLIIGSLPTERGVVATCSYEARAYGVRSAMNIKEAYNRCPHGVYMHPNMDKYTHASRQFHAIWADYSPLIESISLDEGFLDMSHVDKLEHICQIAHTIKQRTLSEVGLTCSVGVGYCMMAAKLASEENKPNGFFAITTPEALTTLIAERSVRCLPWIGEKTQTKLNAHNIHTVSDLLKSPALITQLLGKNHASSVLDYARGIDPRRVQLPGPPKSLGRENTYQTNITTMGALKRALAEIAPSVSADLTRNNLYAHTITLKIKYADMTSITRSRTGEATRDTAELYNTALALTTKIDKRPMRLVGISASGLTPHLVRQLSLADMPDIRLLD